MRIIAYNFNDSNLKIRIESFAKEEGFECADIKDINEDKINNIFVLFTDINSDDILLGYNFLPLCCIGFKPNFKIFYYKLENNFNIYQFRALLDAISHGGLINIFITSSSPVLLRKKYIFANKVFNVEDFAYLMTQELVYYLNFYELQKIRIGLAEILINAIEHGNLGIKGEEKFKATEEGTYIDLLKERMNEKSLMDKHVYASVYVDATRKRIIFEIEDEGEGFDKSIIKKFSRKKSVNLLHGRGIIIAKAYFDRIIYNKKGNKVKLTRKF